MFTSMMDNAGVKNSAHIAEALDDKGFFDAPASTRFHGAYAGGLFDHSMAVAKALAELTEKLELKWQRPQSPIIVGLLHDICKYDNYLLNEDGTYSFNKVSKPGHGEKSVEMAKELLAAIGDKLTEEEELSIRWHMGAFDSKDNWKFYGDAVEKYPNVLYTHTADMIASRIMET